MSTSICTRNNKKKDSQGNDNKYKKRGSHRGAFYNYGNDLPK